MKITTIGLDLAKRVFQVHGIDAAGQVVVRKTRFSSDKRWMSRFRLSDGARDRRWSMTACNSHSGSAIPNGRLFP